MNLPSPKKSILHLRDKFATKKNFFVSDFDKKCLESIIHFHNVVENETKIEHDLFYRLVFLLIRYEIVNNRLNNQLKENKSKFSIIDIFEHIEKLIFNSNLETETVKLILEMQAQKTANFLNSGTELTKDNLHKLHFSDSDTDKALEMVNDFILLNVLKLNDND